MRKTPVMFLTLIFLLSVILAVAQSTYWFDYVVKPHIQERKSIVKEREIHPGVIHITEFKSDGPYLINVLKVNLRQQGLALEAEKGQDYLFGGEKVSQIAQRENRPGNIVIAGINGDFWRTDFIPIGPFVDDGIIFKSHHIEVPRAVFMLDSEMTPYIGVIKMKMVLEIDKETTCPIDVINANGEAKELLAEQKDLFLFTPAFGNATRTSADDRTEVILENLAGGEFIPNSICRARVLEIRKDAGNTTFSKQQLVLSGTGKAKEFLEQSLHPGKEVKIKVTVSETTKPIVLMIGGGPILLQKGEIKIDNKEEGIGEAFVTDKHPRTAIGYSQDKNTIFLYTIDGRQPGLSIGADLYQVAEYLRQLGAYEAMNLDGGGSTTMWVRGELVNKPSDRTGERTVTNALLLVSKTIPGTPQYLKVHPEKINLTAGGSVKLMLILEDKFHHPLPIEEKNLEMEVSPQIGEVKEGYVFKAGPEIAEGKLTIKLKDNPAIIANIPVKIEQPARIKVAPDTVVLRTGDEATLDIKVLNAEGQELAFRPDDITINLPEFIARSGASFTIKALSKGEGEIILTLGKTTATVPIFVDMFKEKILFDFDQLPSPAPGEQEILTGKLYDKGQTQLMLEQAEIKQGKAGCRLNYAMLSGGTTAIYIPINSRMETPPEEITLWVYGDGKSAWLRGEIVDRDGEQFLLDFTSGGSGIHWTGWRLLRVLPEQFVPKWTNPGATIDYPVVLKHLYIAQQQEKLKASGSIILDALTAIYPPEVK